MSNRLATVTMTLTDTLHGTIEIAGEVDPPIIDGHERTPAQELGFRLLKELLAIQEAGRLQRMTYGHQMVGGADGKN